MSPRRFLIALAVWSLLAGLVLGYFGRMAAGAPADADRLRDQLAKERRHADKLRQALKGARSRPAYVWWSTGSTRKAVEAVFDERAVPGWKRTRWRCIFQRESGFVHDIWYGGARGWRPEYAGSDRVNGVAQLRPFWAWWWLNGARGPAPRHDASLTSYRVTSDPVTSTRIALRIGFGPFFASSSSC